MLSNRLPTNLVLLDVVDADFGVFLLALQLELNVKQGNL